MKKLIILSILLSVITLSCKKDPDPDPEPEVIRAYVILYHFVSGLESTTWMVDGVELPNAMDYAEYFPGAVILENSEQDIEFTVKNAADGQVLTSQLLTLEKDKYYYIILTGSSSEPVLVVDVIDTTQPQPGKVKFQFLDAVKGPQSIDVYMGGSTSEKRVISDLEYNTLSLPVEVTDSDARAAITISAHSAEYNQDSVLLTSVYNGEVISGAGYLSVIAPFTFDPESELTFWLFQLPQE
jgi:hypothetical protein